MFRVHYCMVTHNYARAAENVWACAAWVCMHAHEGSYVSSCFGSSVYDLGECTSSLEYGRV